MPRVVRNGIHGVLLLDKPAGLSSNVAVQRVRRQFGWAKAGHTGTLDPLATGLLPVCIGEATKFSHLLLDADKTYEAVLQFGLTSTTGDAEGQLLATGVPAPSRADLETVLPAFLGTQRQTPPMYSALKRDGRPLYEYAREGTAVEREAREITIHELALVGLPSADQAAIRVRCSKGTYIRVLAEDIGARMGCGAYLASLRRIAIADLGIGSSVALDQLEALPEGLRSDRLLPMDCLVRGLPKLVLDVETARRTCHGLGTSVPGANPGLSRLYDAAGRFLGLGEVASDGTLAPRRLISESPPVENGAPQGPANRE